MSEGCILVDAALDTTFMANIVDTLEKQELQASLDPETSTSDQANRSVTITTCDTTDDCSVEESLAASAIKRVQNLLEEVIKLWSAHQPNIHRAVGALISDTMKDKRMLVYNSSRCGTSLEDVNNLWIHYDLLVYSPSVSAGVSFTEQPFRFFGCIPSKPAIHPSGTYHCSNYSEEESDQRRNAHSCTQQAT
jgi:hypothetical protein